MVSRVPSESFLINRSGGSVYISIFADLHFRSTPGYLIPQRRGSKEPSPRGPFGLSALFHLMFFLFFGFPLGTHVTYCVVGGGLLAGDRWWVRRIFDSLQLKIKSNFQ